MDKENHSLLIVESNNFSKTLNTTFNNIGFLWKIKVERKNIDALSGINFKEYNFIIFNGYEKRLDGYLNYFQQIQKPLLIFFNKPIKLNTKAVKILGIKKVEKFNFIATNCKLNPQYSNKLLPKTFIYENTPINFSGYLVTDHTCDYIYKTFLGKNIVTKKENIFCFSFSGWQLGVKNFKPFFSLLLYIFLNYVDFIFLPKPMTSIRIDDWPYTSEGYLKGKKINDEKREKELIELKRFCRLTKSKFDIMVNSHLINQKKNIIPIECKYPKTVSILKELSVLAKVKIGSHGAYHINYLKYLNEGIMDPREFLNVSSKEASADLEKNINWIKKMFKQNPDVFVPPCWEYGGGLNTVVNKYFKIICFSNYQLKDINNEIFINFNKNITKVYETIKYNPSINIYDKTIWEDYFLCGIPCIYLFHNIKNRYYAKERILQLLDKFGIYIYILPILSILVYCFTGKINISILIIISLIIFILKFFEFNLKSAFNILKSLFMTNRTLININKNRFCFLNELVEYYKEYESIYFFNGRIVNPGGIEYRRINKSFKFEDYNK